MAESRYTDEQMTEGRRLFSAPASFRLGVAKLEQLPPLAGTEIAFAGRSNVGKSSLINALTGVRGLARASNTPGRTRELNFFDIDGRITLVDMPGYGYAKAPKTEVKQWQDVLKGYLRGRVGLTRVFVLIDARHGVKAEDREMFDMLDETAVAYQLVLTKTDKIKASELAAVTADTLAIVKKRAAALPVLFVTSSDKGTGFEELRAEIAGLIR
ncbi:MAG: YihA family ribosome biogenesis GTP-binding protein [Rhizobiales bacterium]|nr:YihA family ribosome biogenesis GTP-binding protein [Hyphomicrobiales bacterium]